MVVDLNVLTAELQDRGWESDVFVAELCGDSLSETMYHGIATYRTEKLAYEAGMADALRIASRCK
jgi:hypothetical protein